MAASRIPEEVKQYRPGPCTEIKLINGHYYVYMYQSLRLPSGKWGKKTGKSIGTIIPGTGFIPNRNYHLFTGEESCDEITVLEYGQYALIETIAGSILSFLRKNPHLHSVAVYSTVLFPQSLLHLLPVHHIIRFQLLNLTCSMSKSLGRKEIFAVKSGLKTILRNTVQVGIFEKILPG